MDSADLRASTGSRTGRTPGLRPSVPMPRASLATTGPPPHLAYLASIWTTLGPEHRAKLETVSLHNVEEGLARARVFTQDDAIIGADRHAIELATAEHKRLVAPLHENLTTLRQHSATARSDIQEQEARVASLTAQVRSTIAAIAAAERGHTSFLSGLSVHQPAPPHPVAHAAPTARQHPAPVNLTTLVAPLVPQPMALGASVVPTAATAARPLGSPAPAPTRPLVPLAGTLPTRHTMQTPAPRESRDPPSSTPWSVVVARHNRHKQLPPPTPRTDRYLELPISRFTFRNKAFPPTFRVPIKDHATEVHETLWALTGKRYRLNRALALATQDLTPLSERVVNATLRLRDLVEAACDTTDGAQWLHDTLRKIEMDRANRTESSPATPLLPPANAVAKNPPAAEGTRNGPPSPARIVTPDRTPNGLNETDGKYPL